MAAPSGSGAARRPPPRPPTQVCRCLPWITRPYKLDELSDVPTLRTNVAKLFRQHETVVTPEVIDLLIYKGREELEVRVCVRVAECRGVCVQCCVRAHAATSLPWAGAAHRSRCNPLHARR